MVINYFQLSALMNYAVEYKYLFELTPSNQNKNGHNISKIKTIQTNGKRSSQKYH